MYPAGKNSANISRERVQQQQSPKVSCRPAGQPSQPVSQPASRLPALRATLLERKIGRASPKSLSPTSSSRNGRLARSRASGRKRGRPLRAEARTYRRSSKSQLTYRACTGGTFSRRSWRINRPGSLEAPEHRGTRAVCRPSPFAIRCAHVCADDETSSAIL